jgi:C4-type Zn-finger protein
MKLIRKTQQYRRDFSGILECQSCNHQQHLKSGYDDMYYHKEVIPNIKCENCMKSSIDLGETETTSPDVPAHVII